MVNSTQSGPRFDPKTGHGIVGAGACDYEPSGAVKGDFPRGHSPEWTKTGTKKEPNPTPKMAQKGAILPP